MKKTLFTIMLVLILVLALAGCTGETPAEGGADIEDLNVEMGEKSMALAVECAALLNGEGGDAHAEVTNAGSRDIDVYQAIYDIMSDFKEAKNAEGANITFVYTLSKVNDEVTNLIVDASGVDNEDDYGTEYEMEPSMVSAFEGQAANADYTWEHEELGVLQSAFAPIYNANGEVVAILGIDIAAPDLPVIE